MKKTACPNCGGHLVYENFGQYGRIHRIAFNGKIQKRYVTIDYGGDDALEAFVYCQACGWESRGKFVEQNHTITLGEDEE